MEQMILLCALTGRKFKRVNKTAARKAFFNGKEVILCPHKLNPFGVWRPGIAIQNTIGDTEKESFDKEVINFEYYNCSFETGYYASYYLPVVKD